jgi:hypothetical protein
LRLLTRGPFDSGEIAIQQSLYRVLDLPSTATRAEIRAAYQRQLARIRSGEIRSTRRPLIERAWATLGDPDRRISYDVQFAKLPRWQRPESHLQVLLSTLASSATVVVVAIAGLLFVASALRSQHHAPAPVQATTSQPQPVTVALSPPAAVAAPSKDVAEQSGTPVDAVAPEPQAPAFTARPAVVQSTATFSPSGFSVISAAIVPAVPAETYTDDTQVAVQPAADATEAAAPTAPSLIEPSLVAPSLVQASSYGRIQATSSSRLNFRVQGWFCSDASGGQVFVPAGAPLPSGVNYQ